MAGKDVASTLKELIQTDEDAAKGFNTAAEHVKSEEIRSLFERYAMERRTMADELRAELGRAGGSPEEAAREHGSMAGAIHRGWIDIRSAVGGGDAAILTEAERGEDRAKDRYDEALESELPADLRNVVDRQYRQVMEAHDRVRSLRDELRRAA